MVAKQSMDKEMINYLEKEVSSLKAALVKAAEDLRKSRLLSNGWVEGNANKKHYPEPLTFDEWFNLENNMDLRLPLSSKLSFVDKLTVAEWKELVGMIYLKYLEARTEEK
jgi:hypothetical protein